MGSMTLDDLDGVDGCEGKRHAKDPVSLQVQGHRGEREISGSQASRFTVPLDLGCQGKQRAL